ncbi:hypothetical protein E3N88_15618 [Mikania micrantha]|uniref:1-phosphatidylinositol-4-phosphate 5-kinase n=1 Tax=Mikania micrantha TaxID=192012 RepID=A0A5N6NXC4_9ASTR|nr:hypothetical protein E3N88_15618 [Mikania micrantha]
MLEPLVSSSIEDTCATKKKKSQDETDPKPLVSVGRSRSQVATRRVAPANTVSIPETSQTASTEKRLQNGDLYIGNFSGNVPHGSGKYLWSDGCMYEGDWKRGKASGKGKFSWPSGATYEGEFKSGRMEGAGTFTGADGDTYRGSWSSDRKHGYGQKRYSNGDCYEGSWRRNLPDGHGRYVWTNGNEYVGEWRNGVINGRGMFGRDDIRKFRRNPCCFSGGEVKKPGQMISKGHKNYDLMLNLQLGIRYSVGKHASIIRDLKTTDFDPKEKFWTRFPPEGSKVTPPHQSGEFRWKDYCPIVFRHLRELFQVDPADYMLAICGNDALRELSSPGKSGSFFYLTQDDRFMIKTVKKSEVKVLIKMLPSYHEHVCCYENSLVTKFFGVHCVKPVGGIKTRFIVMGNLFCSEYRIHRRFDLKGSSHGRTTDKPEDEIDETTTLKDLDLNYVFRLQEVWFKELIKQINRDCEFLEAVRIMDYSLLVGMHFRDDKTGDKMGLSPFLLRNGKNDSYQTEKFMRGCRFLEAELQDMDRVLDGRKPLIRLGANMPARAERMGRRSDFDQYIPGGFNTLTPSRSCGETYEVVLYFGIIDILQDYDISKKLEHAYKSLQADPTSISAVDPKLYSKRFRDFIGRIFVEDRTRRAVCGWLKGFCFCMGRGADKAASKAEKGGCKI